MRKRELFINSLTCTSFEQSQLSSSVSKLGKLEGENTERLTEEYVTFILSIVEEFKQTFASGYLSFLSNWVNESCSVYFFAV